ncbi:GntR family transcriptional regulator [Oceanobacillus halophilus]|uniref:GntR family transcriptional regulator n=1 Tax=Oceanobacillus halophilus TaxID=930130 RepID=A0A494ZZB3_9BACI|nr:GntR family transcriptional regulator [Oceanobacillus halophilus]RKQ30499.1 GntR family transcriptional regulator [Oceanobacillus halophilus]
MNEDSIIAKRPLGELIAEHLKQDIYNQKVKFGERLIEADLAENFDVSRSTIREALKILEQEELVTSKARKGTFVSEFTERDLDEMNELRLMIEAKAFVKALKNLEEPHYQDLQSIIDEMKEEAENGNWNALFDLDMQFHQYVVNMCGNSRIIKIYESISVQIRVYLAHLDQYYSSPVSFYREHKELMEALLHKDTVSVERKIKNHISFVEEKLVRKTDSE